MSVQGDLRVHYGYLESVLGGLSWWLFYINV